MWLFPFNVFKNMFRGFKFPFNIGFLGMPFLLLFAYLAVTTLSVLGGVHMHKKTNNKVWLILSGIPSIFFIIVLGFSLIVRFLFRFM